MGRHSVLNRRLSVLLGASLLSWMVGNGLFPLLPLYALERGATVEGAGFILAAGFIGLAAGSLAAPWLARVVGSYQRAYVGVALVQVSAYTLLGYAPTTWYLLALLVIAWFGAGLTSTMVHVMTSLAVGPAERGRAFGLLAVAPPLGALAGATILGRVATVGGYRLAFAGGALLIFSAALVMAFGMPRAGTEPPRSATLGPRPRPLAVAVLPEIGLLLSALLASTALFFGRLAAPLLMHTLRFDPQAVAATVALGGLVTAPVVPLIGLLSDRLGRRPLILATYLLIATALGALAIAASHWQFSVAAALLSLGFAAHGLVTAALAGDMLPPDVLPRTLGRLSAGTWTAAVIAFAGGGVLLERLAAPMLCLLAALLALGAILPLTLTIQVASAEPTPASLQPEQSSAVEASQ